MRTEKVDPIFPISAKKLAKRWGVEPIDIFFIMLNHRLGALSYFGNRVDAYMIINAESQSDDKDFDPEELRFDISDVQTLETQELANYPKGREKLIRGRALVKRWDVDVDSLILFITNGDLSPVDPFGVPVPTNALLDIFGNEILDLSDLLFSKSEIEKFEKDNDHLLSERNKVIASKQIPSVVVTKEPTVPGISFYKKGQNWMIGPEGKEVIFNHFLGFEFIRFLLRYPEQRHDSVKVYYIGNIPDDLKAHLYEKDFHRHSDHETIRVVLQHKTELEEEVKETIDFKRRQELESEIEQCLEFLKDANKSFSSRAKDYRTKVLNGIKRALETIEKESKNSKSLKPVLENLQLKNPLRTIFTGNSCCYSPNPESPVAWLLDPPI